MDEIFDRIKASIRNTKFKHKHLVASLIATEIFGILIFIWILRAPLYEKFLTLQPKAYSLSQIDESKRYLINQGDYLTSQANQNKTILLIWENNQVLYKSRLKVGADGRWTYQLPMTINPGVKLITIGELDQNNNIWSIKNYRFRVKSRDLIDLTKAENRTAVINNIAAIQEEILKAGTDINIAEISTPLPNTQILAQPQEE